MRLLRVGPPGSENPAALIDDTRYVDLPDVAGDFDERFLGAGGPRLVSYAAPSAGMTRIAFPW